MRTKNKNTTVLERKGEKTKEMRKTESEREGAREGKKEDDIQIERD